jgi:hypothetical protein
MIVSPMPEQQLDQPESVYCKYKRLGIQIFIVLDPGGLLRGAKLPLAKEIAKNLVRNLDENHRDTVSAQVIEAITLRKEWAQRYKWAPRHKQVGHQMYIGFLTSIYQQLSVLKDNQATVLHVTEQQAEELFLDPRDVVANFVTPFPGSIICLSLFLLAQLKRMIASYVVVQAHPYRRRIGGTEGLARKKRFLGKVRRGGGRPSGMCSYKEVAPPSARLLTSASSAISSLSIPTSQYLVVAYRLIFERYL